MKKYILTSCFLLLVILLTSCSDWLDVDPKDKTLEKKQFSTEQGIHSVLNGLYMEMASADLYGGKLAITDIEHLGHYYYAPAIIEENANYRPFFNLQSYDYNNIDVQDRFSKVWSTSYELILRANVFIKNVEESTVISEKDRNLMLGEAYAIRAFLHFDLFRLFGPVCAEGMDKLSIPYNDQPELVVYRNIPATEFIDEVMADIASAKLLLKDDPILENGILKPSETNMALLSAEKRFNICLRNRRFNIFAVRMLESRVLFHTGEQKQAAQKAIEILADNDAASTPIFGWVNLSTMKDSADYVFHSEVVFGFENNKLYSSWAEYTEAVLDHSIYGVGGKNLYLNIFDAPTVGAYAGTDIRFQQWRLSSASDIYISLKYKRSNVPANSLIYNFQALMRKSELYYIIAEEAMGRNDLSTAAKNLNEVLINRGLKESELLSEVTPPSKDELEKILEREYYREFVAEGQVFFFHKRRNDTKIFSTNADGHVELSKYPVSSTGNVYIVPLPQSETNN